MSTTFYETPEGQHPAISIDVTTEFAWFFQQTDKDGEEAGDQRYALVRKTDLPAIGQAILDFCREAGLS